MERSRSVAGRHNSLHISSLVAIDGSALFLAARALGVKPGGDPRDARGLDYRALIDVLCSRVPGLAAPAGNAPEDPAHWVMWTSYSHDNAGQNRFLEFAEKELLWAVRRFSPPESFLIDPASTLGPSADPKIVGRLTRFDSSIAFAMGRVAEDRRIVVVSDSHSLAEPLSRARAMRRKFPGQKNVMAFFGRALDPRWQRTLRDSSDSIEFVDLDEDESALFGTTGKEAPRRHDDALPY